jgi:hypothetical protein
MLFFWKWIHENIFIFISKILKQQEMHTNVWFILKFQDRDNIKLF